MSSSPRRMGSVPCTRSDLPIVVVGGYDYAEGMNQPSTVTVRELAQERTVLYIHSEVGGSVLNVARGRGSYVSKQRLARIVFGGMRPRRVQEHLWLAPLRGAVAYPPLAGSEFIRQGALRRIAPVVRGWLDERGHEACLLLFYWPELVGLQELVPWAAAAYDCSDDPTSMPGRTSFRGRVGALEQQLIDAVDRTWVVSPGLLADREGAARRVEVAPVPIDLRLFDRLAGEREAAASGLPEVPGLAASRGPIVGYVGGLTSRMDWALLDEIADRRPQWSLLLVGHDPAAAPQALADRANVVFTGLVEYEVALRLVACFAVGVIPVRAGDFSRGNSFLKLLDYVASGIPVVASDVPDTAVAAASAPDAVAVATGVDQWLAALDDAVAKTGSEAVRRAGRRLAEARSNERRTAAIVAGLQEDRAGRAREGDAGVNRSRNG